MPVQLNLRRCGSRIHPGGVTNCSMENSMGGEGDPTRPHDGPCWWLKKGRAREGKKEKKKRAVKVSPTIEFDEEMEPVGLSPQFILGQQRCRLFGHGRSAVKTRQIVGLTESTWKLDEGLTA